MSTDPTTLDRTTRFEETSFWARQYGAYAAGPPLRGDIEVDVAIVGAGFTGLNTAREFCDSNPGASVAVLESAVVGYGASGRNGGFSMKLFGLEPEITVLRWGRERMVAAHRFMERAVACVRDLVEKHELDSDYRHTGFVRVSYNDRQLRRLHKTLELHRSLGIDNDLRFVTADELRSQIHTPRYQGGLFERETGIMNPCKHVRELKRLAEAAGARVFEQSPVVRIRREGGRIRVETPEGCVSAEKLVLATNAYSRAVPDLPRIRSRQAPVWTYQVVTEPLSEAQWESIGWSERQSFEDNRQLIHYFRPTVDGRITMGGGDIGTPFGNDMDHDFSPRIWRHLEEHLRWIFPQLGDLGFAYRWGGPVSVNFDMTPEVGFIGDARVIYATGYIGHGVSASHLTGRLLADLLAGEQSELTDFWIVNRKATPWPSEPFSYLGKAGVRWALRAWDRLEERGLGR
ncbi:MAG: FAD-binding oxidoreductase [Myxococcota bacterium]|nr:FAD-binding oxidoreductase [Myxococcota bacterium]